MSTNNCFNFSRLGLVMMRDLMENWKKNLYALLGLTFAFLITYLAMMGSYEDASISALKAYVDSHVESFAIISFFALVFYASLIMNNMQTKEARLSYLMLPASPLEKFIARALYVTMGIVLMIFVASLLAEAAHWLFMPFFKDLPEELKDFSDSLFTKDRKIINTIIYGIVSEFLASKNLYSESDFWKNKFLYNLFFLKNKKSKYIKQTFLL